jgi:hypothetical protein
MLIQIFINKNKNYCQNSLTEPPQFLQFAVTKMTMTSKIQRLNYSPCTINLILFFNKKKKREERNHSDYKLKGQLCKNRV